ncbi:MAG: hypothetical protein K6C06_08715 [Lachnospiraceae bacterium]|nr:hypothetical protein [Lachnospiraceae bacterium]
MERDRQIFRQSCRAQLKAPCAPQELYECACGSFDRAKEYAAAGTVRTAALFRFGALLFFYCESVAGPFSPEEAFPDFDRVLLQWPGEEVLRRWVGMRPVYWQQEPRDAEDWERQCRPSLHIGRLARLLPSKENEYLYYHQKLVEEGLHKGDRYQFIAIHENYLFSYYEEPRTNVNIRRVEGVDSDVIREWVKADPASHFYRFYPGAEDFIHLPSLWIVQVHPDGIFLAPPLHPDR